MSKQAVVLCSHVVKVQPRGVVTEPITYGCSLYHIWLQASQCFSTAKAWSLLLVVLGTTTYALSGRGQPAPEVNMEGSYYRAHDDDGTAPAGWVRHSDGGFVRIRGEEATQSI